MELAPHKDSTLEHPLGDCRVREDMLAFLRGLRQEFTRVVLIDDCPPQSESDYDDLTHVNKQRQKEFTEFVGERLRVILPEIGNAH